ncbi:unnamed protein product [Parnassius apollo]|uniref:(apollo) hypothetical protein n=1 Tax=Parnassius apollo TaxID=110799 RepID=A0A8S3WB64_PARAO|nr:unnamed protein product [Parnassius apollo]
MENFKNPKANLLAIYRLEFYKKQKSWKVCTNEKNKKRDVSGKIKNPLNKTYDVLQPETNVCELNEAFIDTCSENITSSNHQLSNSATSTSPKHPTYNYQNELYDWQNEQTSDHHPQNYIHTKLNSPQTESECVWTGDNLHCYGIVQACPDFNGCSEKGKLQSWFDRNKNWSNLPETNQLWTKECLEMNVLNCGDNATNGFYTAEETIPKMQFPWLPDGEELRRIQEYAYSYAEDEWDPKSELSLDSWGEFMRGADIAPHSSEVELSFPNVLSDVELDENTLTRMSSAQLRAAVQIHAQVLRRLLREESQRKRIRSFLSLTDRTTDRPVITPRAATNFSSYDEYPTRDISPTPPYCTACNALHRGKTFTKTIEDTFVAGSHKNAGLQVLGRGRGKVPAVPGNDSRKRIIGIERGRPFRL